MSAFSKQPTRRQAPDPRGTCLVGSRRPDPQHRPDARRHRARLRVHRQGRRPCRGLIWYEQNGRRHRSPRQRAGLRGEGRRGRAGVTAASTTWRSAAAPAGRANALDTSGAVHGFGPCAESQAQEDRCSLNAVPGHDAEHARIAAGTLTPGGTTRPRGSRGARTSAAGTHGVFVRAARGQFQTRLRAPPTAGARSRAAATP